MATWGRQVPTYTPQSLIRPTISQNVCILPAGAHLTREKSVYPNLHMEQYYGCETSDHQDHRIQWFLAGGGNGPAFRPSRLNIEICATMMSEYFQTPVSLRMSDHLTGKWRHKHDASREPHAYPGSVCSQYPTEEGIV